MAETESDQQDASRRDRYVRHTACFTPIENALLMTRVAHAGVSISSFLKCSSLDFPLPRGPRRPTLEHELAALIVAHLGRATTAFRDASALLDPRLAEETARDLTEYRLLMFQALGRKP